MKPMLKPKIVVVDDEPLLLESMAEYLSDEYHVVECSSGYEAISAVSEDVHCVVLDIKMRGKDGFETYEEIRNKFPYLPIIFHTAFQNLKDPYDVINTHRPFGYVLKTTGLKQLQATVNSAVDYYSQILTNRRLVHGLNAANRKLNVLLESTLELASARDRLEVAAKAAIFIARGLSITDKQVATIFTPGNSRTEGPQFQKFRIYTADSTAKGGHFRVIEALEVDLVETGSMDPGRVEAFFGSRVRGPWLDRGDLYVPLNGLTNRVGVLMLEDTGLPILSTEGEELVRAFATSISIVMEHWDYLEENINLKMLAEAS